ncbi:MAG: NAD(P)H-hydrate dehydratase [Blautia sp.]|nr:NAD(P)H-hydrate dehydratase [Blautia sp.]
MKKLVSASLMKRLDADTMEKCHVPSMVLMERAAMAAAERILSVAEEFFSSARGVKPRIVIVCGSGNNGGDGLAIARLLHLKGLEAAYYPAGDPAHHTEQTKEQLAIAAAYHVPLAKEDDIDTCSILVDALFGVGLSRPLEGSYFRLIQRMNRAKAYRIAVDLPSGIDASTGQILGIAFHADETITFAYTKTGLLLSPGREYAGKVFTADVGIYDNRDLPDCHDESAFCQLDPAMSGGNSQVGLESWQEAWLLETSDLALLNKRNPAGNKGSFGKVLVVAGQAGMCGAAYLCSSAVLRSGAGMVKILTVEENRIPLQCLLPEAILDFSSEEKGFEAALAWCDVLVVGPGLGTGPSAGFKAGWFLAHAALEGKPLVLDADGLNLLAANPDWQAYLNGQTVLTPHMGEMQRLCKESIEALKSDRPGFCLALARQTGAVCVLKDSSTVTADAQGRIFVYGAGNSGMATAGSGDVLAGIIGGCIATTRQEKAVPMSLKAALGVFLHGSCGEKAARLHSEASITAGSLLETLCTRIYHE